MCSNSFGGRLIRRQNPTREVKLVEELESFKYYF
jgi:hypothetical protein